MLWLGLLVSLEDVSREELHWIKTGIVRSRVGGVLVNPRLRRRTLSKRGYRLGILGICFDAG